MTKQPINSVPDENVIYYEKREGVLLGNMISKEDQELIWDLKPDGNDIEKFRQRFSVDLSANPNYFKEEWKKAIQAHDEETLQDVLYAECIFYMENHQYYRPDEYYLDDIRQLMKENWHEQHEDLLDILIDVGDDKKDERIYIDVLHTVFDYYKDNIDEGMVFVWKKCIYKLAKIGMPEAIKSVKELRNSPYKHIRETVERQYEIYGWKD